MANTFKSKALYINKELFDAYAVPYPRPGMSWDDALDLAGRFPAEAEGKKLYGLYQPILTLSPFELVMQVGASRKLAPFVSEGTRVLLGSEAWQELFSAVVEGYRQG